jgi:hypothetical protein
MSGFYPTNTAGLAWSTRNLFEINLTIRHVLLSNDNFLDWLGRELRDHKNFIAGTARKDDVPNPTRAGQSGAPGLASPTPKSAAYLGFVITIFFGLFTHSKK